MTGKNLVKFIPPPQNEILGTPLSAIAVVCLSVRLSVCPPDSDLTDHQAINASGVVAIETTQGRAMPTF